jgi:transposase
VVVAALLVQPRRGGGGALYLRPSIVRKGGKTYRYFRLVRSVRRNGKVIQETVAQLGELDARGRREARALAERICGVRVDQQRAFFEPAEMPSGPQTVAVRLDRLRVERQRRFGDVWLGVTLWQALHLDTLCAEVLPAGRESVPWSLVAAILVIARLCEPSSELYVAERWYERTALEDLLGVSAELINDDRLYRLLDHLVWHKSDIEHHLRQRLGELFAIEYDLLLYDVTSTYFEGVAPRNEMARRGHSRDQRTDCLQVCIALVVTRDGLPLGYEVFDGNTTDVTTVKTIVGTMEARYGLAQRIWVMDRGMRSQRNVQWLQETGRRYLVGAPRSVLDGFGQEVTSAHGWQSVHDGVEVKLCRQEGNPREVFLICRSTQRQVKEKAMHARFSARIETALTRLAGRIERAKKPIAREQVERQVGRLLQRNSRAAKRYRIRFETTTDQPAGLRLHWSVDPNWEQWAAHSEGLYVLQTNILDWTPETLWKTYIQLTEAESAFRIHKSDLSLRPIWHQRADRVQAHILVCFLAYVLWKTLEQWQARAQLGNSPRFLLDQLREIQSVDVALPLADDPNQEVKIRCVVRPEPAQAMLLERLGVRLPERLRIPTGLR